jgi:potassium-dependent mechanosensitive channel
MNEALHRLLKFFADLINFPLRMGDVSLSISSIFQLIIFLALVTFFSNVFKRFLKKTLLIKLKIDEGNREAISTIISYGFGSLGFLIVLQTSGFNLASLTVIAGGLGVGIGFGLQDLTKNFVSGLTLLLERKLKVGDFVEFGEMSGYIKEIAIRTTIIKTLAGGDVVVPNSELVSNRVLNWSYDDFTGRVEIPVGVAYSSDPVLVTETLLKSAYMEATVLHSPPPKVIFLGFGENSLDFMLWVWVKRIDQIMPIKSSLNFIIEYNLRQQGIEIPFPQRDLWLKNPETLIDLKLPQNQTKQSEEIKPVEPKMAKIADKPLAIRDLLRQVSYFHNLTDLELRQLIEVGYRKRLMPFDILFKEGDPGDAFYIILSGEVEVRVAKINKLLTTLSAGKFFGELALMLGIPRTATVMAVEETILFAINKQGFEKILQEHPDLCEVIVQELSKHQEELAERQQQLREMGLINEREDDKNLISWVRKRLNNLFNLY